jgi:hypothetical protein
VTSHSKIKGGAVIEIHVRNFLKKLNDKGFKKNNIEYSKDCETFLDKTLDIKFFLIFKKEDSELEPKPEYIVFQSKSRGSNSREK